MATFRGQECPRHIEQPRPLSQRTRKKDGAPGDISWRCFLEADLQDRSIHADQPSGFRAREGHGPVSCYVL